MENITQGQWFRGPSADLGDPINQSLRFRASNQSLSLTPSSSSSRTTWTWSGWLKKGKNASGTDLDIFGAAPSSHASDPAISYLYFRSNDEIAFFNYWSSASQSDLRTTAQFKDNSAWYHIVLAVDTTIASPSSDRIKLYVNGVQITDFVTEDYPAQNLQLWINHNVEHKIGEEPVRDRYDFDGYMAAVYFVDGTQLAATDFGKFNNDGVWVPQDYTGTYGTNGYKLVFDSSAGIGDDSSGNGNDWTANSFQTTSTHENYDLDYNDTPTSNYSTLNALRSAVTTGRGTQDANLTLDGTDENWAATPGTCPQNSGVRFFEMEISSSGSGPNNNFIGFASADCRFNISALQDDATEKAKGMMLFCDDGKTQLDTNARANYSTNMAAGEVIGCQIDFDAEEVEFFRDGTSLGAVDVSSSPLVDGRMVLPVNIVIGSPHNTHDQYLNYGQRDFQHAPTGVTAADNGFQTNNLPEPTIKNGKDHFDIHTYTSASTAADITFTGWEFQPDLVWFKSTSHGSSHRLYDSVRGVNEAIQANTTNAEATDTDAFNSFDSNGFSLGTGNSDINYDSRSFVAWGWKAGGTAVSNTDGTITSSVSANTDAGFSIVSYTGTGANATVGHGLNSPPECIFVKSRDSSANWEVKHKDLSSNDHMLKLNATDAEEDLNGWNNTAPTSSVFSLGAANGTNKSGDDFIAYCWHSVEGYSKFGFYTGNGSSTDQPFVYLGFKPALLIMKRVDGTSNWHLRDTTRATSNPDELWIEADNSAQEQTNNAGYRIDHLSNGFKWRGSVLGTSGSKYIYMAFAENPFGGKNQPPATAR